MEIYVTSGDTIYITEAEKTFTNSSVVTTIEDEKVISCQSGDDSEFKKDTHRIGRRQIGLRDQQDTIIRQEVISPNSQNEETSSPPAPTTHSEKFQIDLPTISMESYPNFNSRKSGNPMVDLKPSSTSPTPFHDPLLNPPPNKVNEWPCGLMILVPLRLGLDSINTMYFEVNCFSSEKSCRIGIERDFPQ